jgi:protein TonB
MRTEIIASSLVHAGMVLAVLFWTGLPADQDAAAIGTVTVDLITTSVVTTNQTEAVESDATEDHALSGAEASNPTTVTESKVPEVVPSETQTLMTTDTLERVPTEVDDVASVAPPPPIAPEEPLVPEMAEAEPVLAVAALDAGEAVTPHAPVASEPIEVAEPAKAVAPVPFTRPPGLTRKAAATPPPPQQAGNGGKSNQDSAAARTSGGQAGAGTGGTAEEARYPGQVERKVSRALRYPKDARGASGEVTVSFAVGSSGQLLRVSVQRSSGNAAIDEAGIASVQRAAPFPPFPSGTSRSHWEFSVPLLFSR